MVTHDPHAAERAAHLLHLEKGTLRRAGDGMKFLGLILKSARRSKRRTALTMISVALAVFLFSVAARRARRLRRRCRPAAPRRAS